MQLVRRKMRSAAITLCTLLLVLTAVFSFHIMGRGAEAVPTSVKPAGTPLPILMYHSMLPVSIRQGTYIVSPKLFEQDLQYLKKEGYTTIVMQDLIDYVNGRGSLPTKPIMLTFDDGYYNNYKYAYPLLKKYNMKIVLSPIGICTDQFSKADSDHATYSHVTWKELNEMLASGLVEVQNHTYNLHKSGGGRLGASKRRSESVTDYQKMLQADLRHDQDLIYQNTGVRMNTFVYPFGAISEAAGDVIQRMGFQATLTCSEKMNYITRSSDCIFGLGRYLRSPKLSTEQFFAKKINAASRAK